MRECIEEGILQAYVDDELSFEASERVAAHLSVCPACTEAAAVAFGETAQLATAFAAEMALDVPTVSLRERIDSAIGELNRPAAIFEERRRTVFGGWLASLNGLFNVTPQRALGFASLVAVIAFAAIFAVVRWNQSTTPDDRPTLASNDGKKENVKPKENIKPAAASPSPTPDETDNTTNPAPNKEERNAPNKRRVPKKQVHPALVPAPSELPKDELASLKPLPGEQNYLKAIDSLSVEIASSGETAMKPSLRAEYERNLAIVDNAINSTRRTARRNPNDPDASAFLYSSYQSKLDLLSAVAEQVRPTIATR
jgi:hypothetical protein